MLFHFTNAVAQRDSLGLGVNALNNRHEKTLWVDGDTLRLDSLLVSPQSVRVFAKKSNAYLSDSSYRVLENQLVFRQKMQDSLFIKYRSLPYALHQPILRKNREMIGKTPDMNDERLLGGSGAYQIGGKNTADALDFEGLTYSGTFARGISMGNNQDLILNSSFNLQIAGKLGDVEVLGAITDNQVPLQPQGNTQQIQDFDRLFIQFKVGKNSLIAGDYDLKKPALGYFTNYYRRLQGAQIQTAINIAKDTEINAGGSFAFSKGKFARYVFSGEEGNQGPYRLRGNNGERFLIVIAGTERVFMDGVLLTRGADQDYVIDYNQGEVKFTNKCLITKDKRLVIEFSYSDLNYLRTIYTAQVALVHHKYDVFFQVYSEQDAKNQPAQETLSDSAKAVLLNVGDDLNNAYISGVQLATDQSSDLVRYKLIDTTANGIAYDSILVFSINPDSALYTARFSLIETGKGDYVRTVAATNGTVYKWVAPDPITGEPQGTHQPIIRLNTPRKQQLMEMGGSYKINPNASVKVGLALSNNDVNTFSKVGNADNWGWAGRLTYEQSATLGRKPDTADSLAKKREHRLEWKAHYEHLNRNFASIEPYRPREFQRDWNIQNAPNAGEHLFFANLALRSASWGRIGYEFSGLKRDSSYFGWKQGLTFAVNFKGLEWSGAANWLQVTSATEKSRFIRPKMDISYTIKPLKNWKWGFYFESEQNRRNTLGVDTLANTSFFFHIWRIYSELPTNGIIRAAISAQRRYDYVPLRDAFGVSSIADELLFSGSWSPQPKERKDKDPRRQGMVQTALDWNFHYRNLRIPDSTRTTIEPKETYLGRLEYKLNLARGFIRWTTTYELGSGQQQRIEYNYVEVDKGQGVYQWIDRNDDGAQQQNEFEIPNFNDQASFIRIVVFTGQFIRSNNVSFNQSLDLDGQTLWKKSNKDTTLRAKVGHFFSRFASRSNFQIERKTLADAKVFVFNPFQLDIADTSLVAVSSTIRNSLFFNRSSPKFSIELNQADDRSKTLLTGGFETRRRIEYGLFVRWTIGKLFSGQVQGALGSRLQGSEFFPERSFDLDFYKTTPQLTLLTKNKLFRTILKYTFKYNQNTVGLMEKSVSHDITTEWKFTPKKTNLALSFSWIQLKYTGATNTPIEFAMTEGLKNGQNFLWSLSFSRYLSKDNKVQLFLNYEGRKTGESRVIHTGRMQIRASF